MAYNNLMTYETRREARKARSAGETVIKVNGRYAIVSNAFYRVWKRANRL